jgi:signal transduction histidine kinase
VTELAFAVVDSGRPEGRRGQALALLVRPTPRSHSVGLAVAAGLITFETFLVVLLKHFAPTEAFGSVYLLGVLLVGMGWGFGLAAITAMVSALAYDYFRSSPEGIALTQPQDWVVVGVFFIVAVLSNSLAALARAGAIEAERRRHEAGLAARQQTALRRVATLVARGVSPSEVFAAVVAGLANCLDVHNAALLRYEPDGTALLLAAADEPGLEKMPVGKRFWLEGESVAAIVQRRGRAARSDGHHYPAESAAARIRALGLSSAVGAPIMSGTGVWGAAVVGSSRPDAFPPNAEQRVRDFADLITIAIANAEAHAELSASRARIVAAADDTRRRIERDLHDGAQQRLVSLGLKLRLAEESVPPGQTELREQISDVVTGLAGVSDELREISHGIHPAVLSKGGLGPALKTLARRSAVPVELDVALPRHMPDHVEVAGYYVAAEALTNVTKHARASEVHLAAKTESKYLCLSIRDNGIGGADVRKGSGLIGLVDRVEALGGQMAVTSLVGDGTSLVVKIPLSDDGPTGAQSSELLPHQA